jgi:hypothetical protein
MARRPLYRIIKVNFYNSINCHDLVVMWSSVVLFILTFAVLGLLLGFAAAVYNTNQEGQTGEGITLNQNASGNATEVSPSGNPEVNNQQSGE